MALEHRLHLRGRHVLAAGDDRVRLAPEHLERAILVEAAEVACQQPPAARSAPTSAP